MVAANVSVPFCGECLIYEMGRWGCLLPVLIATTCFSLIRIRPAKLKIAHGFILLGLLVVGIIFHRDLVIAKDVLYFTVHRTAFNEVAKILAQECSDLKCEAYTTLVPFDYQAELGNPHIWVAPVNIYMGNTNTRTTLSINVTVARYTTFAYVVGQTEIPFYASTKRFGWECNYALGDQWFLC